MNYSGTIGVTTSPWLTNGTNTFFNNSNVGQTSNTLTLKNNSNAVYTTASTVTKENINGKTEN